MAQGGAGRPGGGVAGWGSGLAGVVIFSGSLPATRVAVADLAPLFLTSLRAVVAALLAMALLAALRQARPARGDLPSLALVALGVVVGFPLLTACALQTMTAARSTVFVGLLPLATALFAVLRGGERPRPAFWLFSTLGAATVAGFALAGDGGGTGSGAWGGGELMMIAAIVLCGLGYAEGARLARRLGGWQVICWALVVALPVMAPLTLWTLPDGVAGVGAPAWLGVAYVCVFSMLVGFVFWYRGLAIGGVASVGQLQLLQPFLGLALAGLVLGEPVAWTMVAATAVVVACVAGARRFA